MEGECWRWYVSDTSGDFFDRCHVHDERSAPDSDLRELLERMRLGDRCGAADFIDRYGARLRRRVSGKLNATMRRLFDSQEIMSTVARRLDQYVRAGRLEAATVPALWALMVRITDHSLAEKARVFRALARKEGADGPFAELVRRRMHEAERQRTEGPEIAIDRVLRQVSDATDREILSLWLTDHTHVQTAELLGLAPTAVRKRWQGIRESLRGYLKGQIHVQE